MKPGSLIIFLFFLVLSVYSQTTNLVILNSKEIKNLKSTIKENQQVRILYNSMLNEAKEGLDKPPKPVEVIYYEGLLDTNPKRIETVKSFADIDYVINLIYASYGANNSEFGKKAK